MSADDAPAGTTSPDAAWRTVRIAPTVDAWRAAARTLLEAGAPPQTVAWREIDDAQIDAAELGLFTSDEDDEARAQAPLPAVATSAIVMSGGDPRASNACASNACGSNPCASNACASNACASNACAISPELAAAAPPPPPAASPPRVPRRFVDLATTAACHADPRRWSVLYRVLWRLTHGEPRLLDVAVDDDVHRLLRMDKAVRHDVHKVHAFVRFRRVPADADAVEQYVAWFAPTHDCLPLAAPFFAHRFPNMRWSILGPRRSAHWDTRTLHLSPGVAREQAPSGDALEALWRTYYASIFNPARARPRAMRAEMPKKYWHALPEAAIVQDLLADAPARVRRMMEAEARPPRQQRRR